MDAAAILRLTKRNDTANNTYSWYKYIDSSNSYTLQLVIMIR